MTRKQQLKNKVRKYYRAKGIVLGDYWGGGKGGYASQRYEGSNIKKIMKDIQKDFKTGAIDSGMGYERVTNAIMDIDTITTMDIEGKPFTNVRTKRIKLGKFKKGEKQFLERGMYEI